MKHKLMVALATSLVLVNGTSIAVAAKAFVTDSDDSTTTVPAAHGIGEDSDDQSAYEQTKKNAANTRDKRKSIRTKYETALVNARKTFNAAIKSATTNRARKDAKIAFDIAGAVAHRTYQNAIKARGAQLGRP